MKDNYIEEAIDLLLSNLSDEAHERLVVIGEENIYNGNPRFQFFMFGIYCIYFSFSGHEYRIGSHEETGMTDIVKMDDRSKEGIVKLQGLAKQLVVDLGYDVKIADDVFLELYDVDGNMIRDYSILHYNNDEVLDLISEDHCHFTGVNNGNIIDMNFLK